MAKSITNALAGILVKQDKLDPNAPTGIEAWKNDERKEITIKIFCK
jgi:CubicO group peptidase (beta-lactamase class C family)